MNLIALLCVGLGAAVFCAFAVKLTGLSPLARSAMMASGFGLLQCGRLAEHPADFINEFRVLATAVIFVLLAYHAWHTRGPRPPADRT